MTPHSSKVTVCYFFEDVRGRAVTERYVEMLDNFLVSELQSFCGYNQRTWFQQNKTKSHASSSSQLKVSEVFPEK